ncbi:MAG: DUF177 domain-containing protein [Sphingorhabdus sp.]
MVSANEFSHVVKLNDIGAGASNIRLSADAEARTGLMARFDLAGLDSLDAELAVSRDPTGVLAKGRFRATLAQYCVATGDPVPATIDEPVNIRFVPEPVVGTDAEIELEADDCDSMFHDGQIVDLGEAIAQSLALALDPYPRSPHAKNALKAAGVVDEESAGPFGALAALKDKMKS